MGQGRLEVSRICYVRKETDHSLRHNLHQYPTTYSNVAPHFIAFLVHFGSQLHAGIDEYSEPFVDTIWQCIDDIRVGEGLMPVDSYDFRAYAFRLRLPRISSGFHVSTITPAHVSKFPLTTPIQVLVQQQSPT